MAAKINDLTQGSIFKGLWTMAIPLIGASFVQMSYNIINMLWLGHLGSNNVAAVGAASFFTLFCNSISMITKTGAEITVAQSIGAHDKEKALSYANQNITLSTWLGLGSVLLLIITASPFINFFHFEQEIAEKGVNYLHLVAPGIFFQFNSNTYSGIYNGMGDSRTPFKITSIGLILNLILDPLLIYGWGILPALGTNGAAIATSISQAVVFLIFVKSIFARKFGLGKVKFICKIIKQQSTKIIKIGLPGSLQRVLFSVFALTLATIAAEWGAVGVAVQSIGAQIEAISWLTATGFSTALATFVGQNYGAGMFERIRKCYRMTMLTAGSIGLVATFIFYFYSTDIFALFVIEPEAIAEGGRYLKILALSQIFMITEYVATGAFSGFGRTIPPSIVGILFTGGRIPLAHFLTSFSSLGLSGVWWSITISSIFKGTVLPIWYHYFKKR
ncbi:MAG: MATE family efflux transporter [Culturomica sp.]|jgi:putative MATE family efflux protein|nr:MATE family efflux transporter [Culturomica sp.]